MRRLLPILPLALLTACSHRPEYAWHLADPGALATSLTVALDPRELAWVADGQRPMPTASLHPLVTRELEAHGYRLVPADQADLWVEVIGFQEGDRRGGRGGTRGGPSEGQQGGRHRGGGLGGGSLGRGAGRGAEGHGGSAPPEVRPPRSLDLGLTGPCTLKVQLITREGTSLAWAGTVHLPEEARGGSHRAAFESLVHDLMEPLPVKGK